MKYFYISGVATKGEYEEIFEKIIRAKNTMDAKLLIRLSYYREFDNVEIDQLYETTAEARI